MPPGGPGAYKLTPFEQLSDLVPLHKPPLRVEQTVIDDSQHNIGLAVDAKTYQCVPLAARAPAAQHIYDALQAAGRTRGVGQIRMSVQRYTGNGEGIPPYIVIRKGTAVLTKIGSVVGARCTR
jgi:hypothetical protein